MIASQDEEVVWVLNLKSQEKANNFQTLFPSVNVISQKQIIGFRRQPAVLEQSEEIVILPMNVT